MGLSEMDNETIMLVPKDMRMMQDRDMTCFSILRSELKQGLRNRVEMLVVFRRKIMNEMMTTYFPSVLLMLITYATTFFKPFFFEAALSVNLTTMLVMTTIFISKMESLPPTSDIKMIDIWLILCQLVPFAQVVLLTIKEYLREEENEVEKQDKETQVAGGKAKGPDEKGVELNVLDDHKPQEAWIPINTEPGGTDIMQKLLTIGMWPFSEIEIISFFLLQRRS